MDLKVNLPERDEEEFEGLLKKMEEEEPTKGIVLEETFADVVLSCVVIPSRTEKKSLNYYLFTPFEDISSPEWCVKHFKKTFLEAVVEVIGEDRARKIWESEKGKSARIILEDEWKKSILEQVKDGMGDFLMDERIVGVYEDSRIKGSENIKHRAIAISSDKSIRGKGIGKKLININAQAERHLNKDNSDGFPVEEISPHPSALSLFMKKSSYEVKTIITGDSERIIPTAEEALIIESMIAEGEYGQMLGDKFPFYVHIKKVTTKKASKEGRPLPDKEEQAKFLQKFIGGATRN